MKIVFIRHGDPDRAPVERRGFIGMGRDMAPLSELGVRQARQAAQDPRLAGAQLILSSPYTRAMQTAAILSRQTGLEIQVEIDLHEMILDRTFQLAGPEQQALYRQDFVRCKGEYPAGETRNWESIGAVAARSRAALDPYLDLGYEKIVVVSHGGVICRYIGKTSIGYGEVNEVEYGRDFQCYGWIV